MAEALEATINEELKVKNLLSELSENSLRSLRLAFFNRKEQEVSTKNAGIFLLLIPCSLLLASCTGKKDKTPTYGNLDFEAIASDTAMQSKFEASYEYTKDHNFGNVQYGVASGGFTEFENVLVTERKSIDKMDTIAIVKADSNYRLSNSFIEDKNGDNSPEIHLFFSSKTDSTKKGKTVLFSSGAWRVK